MSFATKKTILTSLATIFLLSWFLFIYFHFFHWRNAAPVKPNPATGQIYEVNNHGYIFYLTKQQEVTAYIPVGIAVVSFLSIAVLENRWKVYERIYGKFRRPLR